MDWYVVYSKPGGEMRANAFLTEAGAEVYLPQYRKMVSHAGKREEAMRPVFPRYMFFRGIPISKANSTPGVSQVVKFGDEYVLIREAIVDELRGKEDATGAIQLSYTPNTPTLPRNGEKVRIENGPYVGHVAVFDGLTEDNRVRILLNIMRRQISLDLPIEDIGKND